MSKKIIIITVVLCLCVCTLFGCSNSATNSTLEDNNKSEDNDKSGDNSKLEGNSTIAEDSANDLSIVCTIFPQYDWVKEMLGDQVDNVDLSLLIDNGVDLHSYQPSAEDIAIIATCDIFIYVGGESDKWVEDALTEATNKDMKIINMMKVLGDSIKEEEIVEGMEAEEESIGEESDEVESNEVDSSEVESAEEELEYDEHIWLSLNNAEVICNTICTSLSELDAGNSEIYNNNLESYIEKLTTLNTEYQTTVDTAVRTTLLFGDRFPFRYMVDAYGLDYYAAFVGCSAETEASFNTIVFLAEKVNELNLPAICVLESSDQSIAQTIVNNTKSKNQKILVINSMQSVTADDVTNGTDYLSIMKSNLEVLKEALN